ncbi:MAG TPA: hypothetical protein VF879_03080 [Nitrospirales bacterium]
MKDDLPLPKVWALYPGQDEPVWCDTLDEAITYMSAENIGRGLPPFTNLQIIKITKGTDEDDPPHLI